MSITPDKNRQKKEGRVRKQTDYTPPPGFFDLRKFDIPKKQFDELAYIQRLLWGWEKHRRAGHSVPQEQELRKLSGDYQRCLFQYDQKTSKIEDSKDG